MPTSKSKPAEKPAIAEVETPRPSLDKPASGPIELNVRSEIDAADLEERNLRILHLRQPWRNATFWIAVTAAIASIVGVLGQSLYSKIQVENSKLDAKRDVQQAQTERDEAIKNKLQTTQQLERLRTEESILHGKMDLATKRFDEAELAFKAATAAKADEERLRKLEDAQTALQGARDALFRATILPYRSPDGGYRECRIDSVPQGYEVWGFTEDEWKNIEFRVKDTGEVVKTDLETLPLPQDIHFLGTTPLVSVEVPTRFAVFVFSKEGHRHVVIPPNLDEFLYDHGPPPDPQSPVNSR